MRSMSIINNGSNLFFYPAFLATNTSLSGLRFNFLKGNTFWYILAQFLKIEILIFFYGLRDMFSIVYDFNSKMVYNLDNKHNTYESC